MRENTDKSLRDNSPYSVAITREHFLFNEMKITAELLCQGLDEDTVIGHIVSENSFNYPMDKSVKQMAIVCLRRLKCLDDKELVKAIATQPDQIGKQICPYAMMQQYRIVKDCMIEVIGNKYRLSNSTFDRMELENYLQKLQRKDPWVASWSNTTLTKVRQVITKMLVDNGYLESTDSKTLQRVSIDPLLEKTFRERGQNNILAAFNVRLAAHVSNG